MDPRLKLSSQQEIDAKMKSLSHTKINKTNRQSYRQLFIKSVKKNYIATLTAVLNEGISPDIIVNMKNGDRAAHIAAKTNNTAMMKLLLAANVDLTICNSKGINPISIAFQKNRASELLDMVLGCSVHNIEHVKLIQKHHDLLVAANSNNAVMLTECITLGVSVNIRDAKGNTPLHIALQRGFTTIAHQLISAGAHIDIPNHLQKTALHLIFSNQYWSLLPLLAGNPHNSRALSSIHKMDYSKVMKQAIDASDIPLIEEALNDGADPNGAIDSEFTYLTYTIATGQNALAILFIKRGASIYHRHGSQSIPLVKAFENLAWDIILAMYGLAGIDSTYADEWGVAASLAYSNNLQSVALMLLRNGAAPAYLFEDDHHKTECYSMLRDNNAELLKIFINHGYQQSIRHYIYHAAKLYDDGMVKCFFDLGIAPTTFLCINEGRNYFRRLFKTNNKEMIALIRKHCPSKDCDTISSQFILDAISYSNDDDVALLLVNGVKLNCYYESDLLPGYLEGLLKYNQTKMIELILSTHPELRRKMDQLKIDAFFIDEVLFTKVNDPYIVPHGSTYDYNMIIQSNAKNANDNILFKDPLTRIDIKHCDTVPNYLVKDLLDHYNQPNVDFDAIPPCLICPETNALFVHPVVAMNGKTYEKRHLNAYLASHPNQGDGVVDYSMPTRATEFNEAYPNRMVSHLIESKYRSVANKDAVRSPLATFHLHARSTIEMNSDDMELTIAPNAAKH